VLHYGQNRVYLFECDWWDIGHRTRMEIDEHFTSVNTSRTWYASNPFILACQASQAFYLKDAKLGSSWQVVQKVTHRNIYDVPTVLEGEIEEDDEGFGDEDEEDECVGGHAPVQQGNDEDSTPLRRDDVEPIVVDRNMLINDEANNEENETTYDDEEELSSNDDTKFAHEEELSSNSDTDSENDVLNILYCEIYLLFCDIW